MQYNGATNGQDIVTRCDDLANSTPVTYPINEKTRAANAVLAVVWSWILDAYNGWQLDDTASTDFPVATTTLNQSQQFYDIPNGAQTIRGLEVLPAGGTVYQKVSPITEEEITQSGLAEASFMMNGGIPVYYRPMGNSIKLYPTPNYTQAAGLRVTYDRGLQDFVPTDTTKQPGFASQFHEVVPTGMALDFAVRHNLPQYATLQAQYDRQQMAIKQFYSKRYQEMYPNVIKMADLTQQYI